MANTNATKIVQTARDNGWTVKIEPTPNVSEWRSDKSCGMRVFDTPTHIVTFTRGDQSATMPVTPHAGVHTVLDGKSMPKPAELTAFRYVRGNRALGTMSGTDGKPVLIDALAEQLTAKPPRKRTARKSRAKSAS